jgi:ABC-type transporter Mla MlaB component
MNNLLPLTIENAKKNKDSFLSLLDGTDEIVIDVSNFGTVDLSGLQLLIAFTREASARKKTVSFSGTVTPDFSRALTVSGLVSAGCATAEDAEAAIKAVS